MINRIKQIIDYYRLNASGFADTIGVQRSALSHVLSGRNKPSLDFITKTKAAFPQLSLDWLILGTGEMFLSTGEINKNEKGPSGLSVEQQPVLNFQEAERQKEEIKEQYEKNVEQQPAKESRIDSENTAAMVEKPESGETGRSLREEDHAVYRSLSGKSAESLEMIVVYYKDGTFKRYLPR